MIRTIPFFNTRSDYFIVWPVYMYARDITSDVNENRIHTVKNK